MSYYIGLMCGTSMDSIDAALMDFSEGRANCLSTYQLALPGPLKREVLHLSIQERHSATFTELDAAYATLFSEAVLRLLAKAKITPEQVKAIGCHGQTVLHNPEANPGYSLQLGDIEAIAQQTGILTIGDFRTPDIQAGGQGAPLVPPFHQWCFHSNSTARAIINLGGIANISWLPAAKDEPILGWDIGPANALLDAWMMRFHHQAYDADGQWAAGGNVNPLLYARLQAEPYFQRTPPKSTGKSLFNLDWLDEQLWALDMDIPAQDVQCTLTHLTAKSIASTIHSLGERAEVILCGGGVFNTYLWQVLEANLGSNYSLKSSEVLGLSPQWVEAACFAWLAQERVHNRAANCPSVTGANKAVLLGTCSSSQTPMHQD